VAAISVSGGGAVMIADAAFRNGLRLPDYDPQALAALKVVNDFVNDRNPIDISAPSMRDMAITAGHIEFGLQQPPPTTIGYISHIPMVRRTGEAIIPRLLALPQRYPGKLLALAMNASPEDRRRLVENGIAVFDDPVIATECVARLIQTGMAFDKAPTRPEPARALAPMEAGAVQGLLATHGIAMVPEWPALDLADALACLRRSDGGITLKLSAPGLVHRTEVDGVELALDDEAAVRAAHARLQARRAALHRTHDGLTIVASPMVADAVEFHAGVRMDSVFGPLVFLGSGGTLVEMFDDTVYRKVPFNQEDAIAMVDAVRVSRQLDGWRGRPAADRDALVQALLALGRLACDARSVFASLEINPLMVRPRGHGVIGVDLVVGSVPAAQVP
jgi:acyl-CoA synthetase (NDP forming)